MIEQDSSYTCPSCGEEIVIPIDPTQGADQEYVEDCPVCCAPVLLRVTSTAPDEWRVDAESE